MANGDWISTSQDPRTYQQRMAAGAAAKAAAIKEQQNALARTAPKPVVTKPSPQSVTGIPKTNANNSISGSIKPITSSNGDWIKSRQPTLTNPVPTPTLPSGNGDWIKSRQSTQPQSNLVSGNGDWINSRQNTQPSSNWVGGNGDWINSRQNNTLAPTATPADTTSAGTTLADTKNAANQAQTNVSVGGYEGAINEYETGQNAIVSDLKSQMSSDIALIQAEAERRQAELDRSLDVLRTLHEQNLSALDASTAAAQVANENAIKKQEAAVKNAQAALDQKYLELKAAQKLENKRAEIRKETALGVLGGTFSTAGTAEIEETIMQGEQALNNLGLSNINSTKELNDQLTQFYDEYRQKNLEIQSYKMNKINESYANLQSSIASIMAQKEASAEEKERQILEAGRYYNNQIAQINGQVVQAKYQLATSVIARAEELKAQYSTNTETVTNRERDDARAVLQNIISTYSADDLARLSDIQKRQIADLEAKAGYPVGLTTSGITTMKENLSDAKISSMNIDDNIKRQLYALKRDTSKKVSYFNNGDGRETIAITDLVTGKTYYDDAGNIGTPQAKFQIIPNPNGNGFTIADKTTGAMIDTSAPSVSSGGVKGDIGDALDAPVGTNGGQCGKFVNDYLSKRIIPDQYQGKATLINSKTPDIGSIFVMRTALPYGHVGFVKQVGTNPKTGNPGILAKDSNWNKDGKVQEHWIDQNKITGYITTNQQITQNAASGQQFATAKTPAERLGEILGNIFSRGKISEATASKMSRSQLIGQIIAKSEEAGIAVDKKALNDPSMYTDDDLRAVLTGRKKLADMKAATAKNKLENQQGASWAELLNNINF
jgi:hypothetical protein